jgi:hypothetical protein
VNAGQLKSNHWRTIFEDRRKKLPDGTVARTLDGLRRSLFDNSPLIKNGNPSRNAAYNLRSERAQQKKGTLDDAPNRRRPVGVLKKNRPEFSCREIDAREIHKYEIIAPKDHRGFLLCTGILIVPTA